MPSKKRKHLVNQSSSTDSSKGTQKYLLFAAMGFIFLFILMYVLWPTQAIQVDQSPASLPIQPKKKVVSPAKVTATILAQYPHDSKAFTQGMEVYGDELYESTGLLGQSTLRKVDLITGKVLKQYNLPSDVFGEGITIFNNLIYLLTWQNKFGYVFDLNFNEIKKFEYKTEGWGITHDKDNLIMSDGSNKLYYLSPQDFKIVKVLNVMTSQKQNVRYLNELEFIDGYIYANIWYQDQIAVINPNTGIVVQWIDCSTLNPKKHSEAVLNGIAFNSGTRSLYLTGKLWSSVFHVAFNPVDQSEG